MSNLLLIIYIVSGAICLVSFLAAVQKMDSASQSNKCLVWLGMLSIVPFINMALALFCIYWKTQDFKPFNIIGKK